MIKVFIGHSSRNDKVAELLVEVLCQALRLERDQIRCTSVEGSRLPAGQATVSQLSEEIRSVSSFVAIISQDSLKSTICTLEIGMRWGASKHARLVVLREVMKKALPYPLGDFNVLVLENEHQVIQLIEEIGSDIGAPLARATNYLKHVQSLARAASEGLVEETAPILPPKTQLPRTHRRILQLMTEMGFDVVNISTAADHLGLRNAEVEISFDELLECGYVSKYSTNSVALTKEGKRYLRDEKLI